MYQKLITTNWYYTIDFDDCQGENFFEITPPNTFVGSSTNKDYSVLFFLILGLIGLVFKKESKLFD